MRVSRREFHKTSIALGAATALKSLRVLGANDRVNIGIIGTGGRGRQILKVFLAQPDSVPVHLSFPMVLGLLGWADDQLGRSPSRHRAVGDWSGCADGHCRFGGRYALKDGGETPDVQHVAYQFPGCVVTWTTHEISRGRTAALTLHGSKGTMGLDRSGFKIVPEVWTGDLAEAAGPIHAGDGETTGDFPLEATGGNLE